MTQGVKDLARMVVLAIVDLRDHPMLPDCDYGAVDELRELAKGIEEALEEDEE